MNIGMNTKWLQKIYSCLHLVGLLCKINIVKLDELEDLAIMLFESQIRVTVWITSQPFVLSYSTAQIDLLY